MNRYKIGEMHNMNFLILVVHNYCERGFTITTTLFKIEIVGEKLLDNTKKMKIKITSRSTEINSCLKNELTCAVEKKLHKTKNKITSNPARPEASLGLIIKLTDDMSPTKTLHAK